MKWFVLILILAGAGAWTKGYRIHPQNLPHYMKFSPGEGKQEITLTGGGKFSGIVQEETADTMKLNVDGAVMTLRRSEIASVKSADLEHPLTVFKKNYDLQKNRYPLVTKKEAQP
jgi:hypothetical protein